MNKFLSILWVGVLLASITACVSRERTSQPDVQPTGPNVEALPDDLTLGEYVDVDGARIYALIDEKAPQETIYITLDEAMAAKVCTVREVGAAVQAEGEESAGQDQAVEGDVNKLLITNAGSKPIFLMAGDLVLGGKQDRILGESVLIDANTKDQPIPVFCVEHGRWTTQDKDGDTGKTGYFMNDAETGQVDVSVKKAALGSAQQREVWESVSKSNAGLGVEGETSSGTFRAAFDSKTIKEKIETNFDRAKDLVGNGVVGFVVFVDDEPVAMDAFDSVELCNKLSEKLLRSYIVSGINGGYEETATGPAYEESSGPSFMAPDESESYDIRNVARSQSLERESAEDALVLTYRAAVQLLGERDYDKCLEKLNDILELDPDFQKAIDMKTEIENGRIQAMEETTFEERISGYREALQTLQTASVQSDTENLRSYTRNTSSLGVATQPAIQRSARPNDRTSNNSEVTKKAVRYTCKDKKTGKAVQRSFMRR